MRPSSIQVSIAFMTGAPPTTDAAWRRALAAVAGGFRRAGRLAVDVVYPPQCIGCGAATADPAALCPACWRGLAFIARPYCERLGTPFAIDIGGPLLSPEAIADPPVFERARAAVLYDGLARDLVHRLKYGDRLDLARALAGMMATAGAELLAEADVLVPVPLHWTRLWSRRFNQAALLADALRRDGGPDWAPFALRRRKRTRPQVGLTQAQRRTNLQGAFVVPAERAPAIEGRRVLLVDDVMTTAATANASARALLRAGATAVDVLTFARVVKST